MYQTKGFYYYHYFIKEHFILLQEIYLCMYIEDAKNYLHIIFVYMKTEYNI